MILAHPRAHVMHTHTARMQAHIHTCKLLVDLATPPASSRPRCWGTLGQDAGRQHLRAASTVFSGGGGGGPWRVNEGLGWTCRYEWECRCETHVIERRLGRGEVGAGVALYDRGGAGRVEEYLRANERARTSRPRNWAKTAGGLFALERARGPSGGFLRTVA